MCKFRLNILPMKELFSQAMSTRFPHPLEAGWWKDIQDFLVVWRNQPELPPDQHLEVGELGEPFSHHHSPPVFETRHIRTCVSHFDRDSKQGTYFADPRFLSRFDFKKHVRSSSLRRESLPAEMNSVKQLPQLHDSSQGSWSSWMTLQQEWGLQDKAFCKSQFASQPAKVKQTLKYHSHE